MPEEIQLLAETKKREPDTRLRLTLCESLVLLTYTRRGREILRDKKVYPVIRMLHKVEADEDVQDACERIVNMLMRDESHSVAEEVGEDGDGDGDDDDDEDNTIEEVI